MPAGDSMTDRLVIRGGLIVDGRGGPPVRGDVAVDSGRVVAVGDCREHSGVEIDASGCIVTPGFVDVHTHYDGQAIWSSRLSPSSRHGVTTVVLGNCGVGFAPCRTNDRALLMSAMEGVEDIPELVMSEGLTWAWQSFADYLDELDRLPHDVDVGALIPHSPVRVYAMGERGVDREVASRDDIATMAEIVRQGMAAGALGFSTSRSAIHRRGDGAAIPSFGATEHELAGIAAGMGGRGVFQTITNVHSAATDEERHEEIAALARISAGAGVPVTFSLTQQHQRPETFEKVVRWAEEFNRDPSVALCAQYAPRPIGVYVGFALSSNPFSACPTYQALSDLPLLQRLEELRKPEIRARIIEEPPSGDVLPLVRLARQFERTYVVADPPTYEPSPALSIAVQAAERGLSPEAHAYDVLLADEGRAMLYVAIANYALGNLDHVADLLGRTRSSVLGLGDGGAHYSMVCDASYPTFVLTHWLERDGGRWLSIQDAVRLLTSIPAALFGLTDRGVVAAGARAHLNVIDLQQLRLSPVHVRHDLPAGGRRLDQTADGYRATLVNGRPILVDDEYTEEMPGRLVRGNRL